MMRQAFQIPGPQSLVSNLKKMKDNQSEATRHFLSYAREMLDWEPKERYTAAEA